jgi:hypothetical protein
MRLPRVRTLLWQHTVAVAAIALMLAVLVRFLSPTRSYLDRAQAIVIAQAKAKQAGIDFGDVWQAASGRLRSGGERRLLVVGGRV